MNPKKTTSMYLLMSALLFVFQFVYHKFGHGVTSLLLSRIYVVPLLALLLVVLLYPLLMTFRNRLGMNLYNSGVALWVAGGILQGILEIAGSDSPYIGYYWGLGGLFLLASLGNFCYFKYKQKRKFQKKLKNAGSLEH